MTAEETEAKKEKKDLLKYIRVADIKWFGAGIVAIILATVGVQAYADERIDKSVQPVKAELAEAKKQTAEALKEINRKIDANAAEAKKEREEDRSRSDQRWQAILWKLNVPDPARDAGQ